MKERTIREAVRKRYGGIAAKGGSCCGPASCRGEAAGGESPESASRKVGYTDEQMRSVPEGSNLGLGCGNPVALASLREGDTVLDLGAGAGFDCFLASARVGPSGRVIGVDMTPEMLEKARGNAERGGYANVEFRLGEIENLPAADASVDIVISNCVINLAPDKSRVFAEAFRVLRPGGRLAVTDIVLREALPERVRESVAAYVGCIAGATLKEDYVGAIEAAGFEQIAVAGETSFPVAASSDPVLAELAAGLSLPAAEASRAAASVVSIAVTAVKPKSAA